MVRLSPFSRPVNYAVHAFLPPAFLFQPSAGIDISSGAVKYMDASFRAAGYVPRTFDRRDVPEGVLENGVVRDEDALVSVLESLRKEHGRLCAAVSIPEEAAYLFTFTTDRLEHLDDQVDFALAENVPVDPAKVVADHVAVPLGEGGALVSVVAYEAAVLESYLRAVSFAGFSVKHIEPEVFAIARSVVPHSDVSRTSLVLDVGAHRSVVMVTRGATPVFATTVAYGMAPITELIAEAYGSDMAEVYRIQNYIGLQTDKKALVRKMRAALKPLLAEVARQFSFWDSRRDAHGQRINRIEQVYLCGGGAALKGFREQLAAELRVPVSYANVWQHLFDLNRHLPDISRNASLQYAALSGLLLTDVINQ